MVGVSATNMSNFSLKSTH